MMQPESEHYAAGKKNKLDPECFVFKNIYLKILFIYLAVLGLRGMQDH